MGLYLGCLEVFLGLHTGGKKHYRMQSVTDPWIPWIKIVKDVVVDVSCSTLGRTDRVCWIGDSGIPRAMGWPQDLRICESRGCA